MTNGQLLQHALAAHDAGLAVVPIKPDGQKRPAIPWATYQDTPPTRDQVTQWFTTIDTDGLGIITGASSGNLEMFEAEGRALGLLTDLAALLADNGLGELWDRLNKGWVEATPSGGIHWHYRITDGPAARNTKLARRPATPDELATNPADKVKVLIETRGQGGFTVIAPSHGRTHPTGRPWTTLAGGPHSIPELTTEERDALFIVAGALDAMPTPDPLPATASPAGRTSDDGLRPGDDYNNRATWDDILTPHGWTKARRLGTGYGWTRPGKELRDGISATTGTAKDGVDRLYVFSTSTEFEAERPYSKFSAYALLEHDGDHSAAARQLRTDGYGTPPPPISGGRDLGDFTPSHDEPAENMPADIPAAAAPAPGGRPTLTIVDGATARVTEPLDAARLGELYGPTEDGTARALADLHHQTLRYCPQRSEWLSWTGSRWEWDTAETHRELIRHISRELPEDDGWKAYKKRALSASGVTGIARLAQTDPRLTVHIDQLDANPYELNTPGGIIDLHTGTLRPADPAAMHTRTTTVTPDFDTTSDLFTDFLDTTFGGDPAMIAFMARLFGVAAIGTVLEQILPFAHGIGANGKSTLLDTAQYVLGTGESGYSISAPAEMLMARKYSEHPAELAQLAGARLVVCSELDEGQYFAEARIKMLTGRDAINARFMRGNPFTFHPSHTFVLAGNHKPDLAVGGPAFERRIRFLPFDHVVPEGKRDPLLGEKLKDHAPAVLAWIARGAAEYLATRKLNEPASVLAATHDYVVDQDTVTRFLEDRCHLVTGMQTPVTDVRSAYEEWCREVGDTPVSARRLTQELRDKHGVESVKGTGGKRHYRGLGIAASATDEGAQEWYR